MLLKSKIQGNASENLFYNLCKRDGYEITKSTIEEDRYKHIDFFVEINNEILSLDVKSVKRLYGKYQDEKYYIEIKNNSGKPGWLYAPQLDVLCFETFENFKLYKRDEILKYISLKGMKNFKTMSRNKDKSLCILISREELNDLVFYTIYK